MSNYFLDLLSTGGQTIVPCNIIHQLVSIGTQTQLRCSYPSNVLHSQPLNMPVKLSYLREICTHIDAQSWQGSSYSYLGGSGALASSSK